MKLARHILLSLSIPLLVSISTADAACRISCGALASYVNWLHGGGDSWGSGVINKSEVAALARKANAGDVEAMRRLGIISMKGIRVKPSATIAIKWWKKAAQRGDAQSMMYLGDVYRGGNGVAKNLTTSMKYYADAYEAMEQENGEQIMLNKDNVLVQRIEKLPISNSISWWKGRAEKDDIYAMYHLATLKKKEYNGILSEAQVTRYMVKAALNGHEKAIKKIEDAEPEKYMEYWKEKAPNGNVDDWMKYARALYKNGKCSEADEVKAMVYFKRAADANIIEAQSWIQNYKKKASDQYVELLLKNKLAEAMEKRRFLRKHGVFDSPYVFEKLLTSGSNSTAAIHLQAEDFDEIINNEKKVPCPYIILAVRNNQSHNVVDALIDAGFDVNATDPQTGETALIAATKSNQDSIIDTLLHAPDINTSIKDKTGHDALAYAANDTIKAKLTNASPRIVTPPDTEAPPEIEETPDTNSAAIPGKSAKAPKEPSPAPEADAPAQKEAKVDLQAILDMQGDAQFDAICALILEKKNNEVRELLSSGVSPNLSRNGLKAQLHQVQGNRALALLLAKNLAHNLGEFTPDSSNLEKLLSFDHTLLLCATDCKNQDIIKELIQRGADVNAATNFGYTPLYEACVNNDLRTIDTLLSAGAHASLLCPVYVEANMQLKNILHDIQNEEILAIFLEKSKDIVFPSTNSTDLIQMGKAMMLPHEVYNKLQPYLQMSQEELTKLATDSKNKNKPGADASPDSLIASLIGGVVLIIIVATLIKKSRGTTSSKRKKKHGQSVPMAEDMTGEAPEEMPQPVESIPMPPPMGGMPPLPGSMPPPLPMGDMPPPLPTGGMPVPPPMGNMPPAPPTWAPPYNKN